MRLEFRRLLAHEIDIRVSQCSQKGTTLLLYKDARCDMNILDQAVGQFRWKREHTRDNANCIVSIWCNELNQWIAKEDTGVESFSDKEKGLASDSFKRACFNWGIGRELYTAPFIWVSSEKLPTKQNEKGKYVPVDSNIFVSEISYDEFGNIKTLTINHKKDKSILFALGKNNKEEITSGENKNKKDTNTKNNKVASDTEVEKNNAIAHVLKLVGDETDKLEKALTIRMVKGLNDLTVAQLRVLYAEIKAGKYDN